MQSRCDDTAGDMPVVNSTVKSYVLRTGRGTQAQLRAYEELAPVFVVPFAGCRCDPASLFDKPVPPVMEIGFGMGEATAKIAEDNRELNYLGVEVYRPGVGRLLREIAARSLANIRIIEHDAVEVAAKMIAPGTLAAVHLFFPDPWPKKRHHKRRLVKRPFTGLLASRVKPGGYIYMVTDWQDYAESALEELTATETLANAAGTGFAPPKSWRPGTSFERKGRAKQHGIWELEFTVKG